LEKTNKQTNKNPKESINQSKKSINELNKQVSKQAKIQTNKNFSEELGS
jgi:hypothetical protein